jgi:hypothetical protein
MRHRPPRRGFRHYLAGEWTGTFVIPRSEGHACHARRSEMGCQNASSRTRRARPSERQTGHSRPSEGQTRRGMLVMPALAEWTIQCGGVDATSASLRKTNRTLASLRRANSEGHACHARSSGMDNPMWRGGRDKRVPPKDKQDTRVPPKGKLGGACLSCPLKRDGL